MNLRHRFWLLFSQTVNALVFRGDPDESVSARAWREQWPKGRARIDRVLGKNHCKDVFELQLRRQQARSLCKK